VRLLVQVVSADLRPASATNPPKTNKPKTAQSSSVFISPGHACIFKPNLSLKESKNPDFVATLAAARAECGQFERALEVAERALKLTSEEGKEEMRSRIALFKVGKPYRAK
jgi:hypothetical protein